ncbi:beta-1,4-galactosyltransferase 3 isoform X2 [Lepeophtheirus salmonis]|uniref:beta-1,4-galactosyltransferase 3 isoform X2 n=1 Tax=Lepeophtheirus salmonis TaxID=72036 RepID=UPI001AE298F2|nr:beta-1,4-galactosyltransferase 3-like isoform X2 [Lepeophtheirus salmonis]
MLLTSITHNKKILFLISILILLTVYIQRSLLFKTVKKDFLETSCPNLSYQLEGNVKIQPLSNDSTRVLLKHISNKNPYVKQGGHFSPVFCNPRDVPKGTTAIIIPYRDRFEHLLIFLQHMHPILTKQKLEYKIYVIHQPRRMITGSSKWNYEYLSPYPSFFGGVSSIKPSHFKLVNGFSNKYFGWGGEDDDLSKRIQIKGLKIKVLDEKEAMIGRYKMLDHEPAVPDEHRLQRLAHAIADMPLSGLNSLHFKLIAKKEELLYSNITVDLSFRKVIKMLQEGSISCRIKLNANLMT